MTACLLLALALLGQKPDGAVEPSALTKDPSLIGREVTVDDRVRYFQAHRRAEGQVFDELLLKRTEVVFRLPEGLRPERPPRQPAVRLTGILRVADRVLYCDVTTYEMMPADLERLDREVKRLASGDTAGRAAWAAWAERRGRDFKDADLLARAVELEAESILIDADRPKADDLALSRRARSRGLDDLGGALAYRAMRAKLEATKSPDDLARLASEIEGTLPRSASPQPAPSGLADWRARAALNPLSAYRGAPAGVQAALDRSLLADALERRTKARFDAAPDSAMALADEARAKLPDRPEVASRLRDRALEMAERGAADMRLSEAEALAQTFRDDGQPDRARSLLKSWLDERRRRVGPGDADGLVELASQYARVLDDRAAAVGLLRDALKADPASRPAADAFRRMGYRKGADGTWSDPSPAPAAPGATPPAEAAPAGRPRGESLKGMSPEQVRKELGGKPDRVSRMATRDATIEQWTYQQGRTSRIVNFRLPRGSGRAEVVSDYALP